MSSIQLLVFGFTAVAVLAIIVIAFSWLVARHLCRPRRRKHNKTPADYGLPFRDGSFYSGKRKLKGWFIPVEKSTHLHPTIILCHGWSSNSSRLLPLAQSLHRAGFAVFLYDTRGHGMSDGGGPVTGMSFAEDLIAAIDSLWWNHHVDPFRIAVVGHSIGAVGAIHAASVDPRIRALVSCSAFADPRTVLGKVMDWVHLPRWPVQALAFRFIERWIRQPISQLAPLNRINKTRSPVLLLHGGADRIVSPSNLHTLADRAVKNDCTQWIEPASGHSDLLLHPVVRRRIAGFLHTELADAPGESGTHETPARHQPRNARMTQVCMN
ncbi:MAG: alpha/beta fold hydrolase [Bacteroidetes bacterium]|nr:alpha/beta fold hydrolase [Bacteroidota bacterium]